MELEGKVALVTGGSSRIGRAISMLFASRGAAVAVLASRDRAKAERMVAEITRTGGIARAYAANVEHPAQIRSVIETLQERFRQDRHPG